MLIYQRVTHNMIGLFWNGQCCLHRANGTLILFLLTVGFGVPIFRHAAKPIPLFANWMVGVGIFVSVRQHSFQATGSQRHQLYIVTPKKIEKIWHVIYPLVNCHIAIEHGDLCLPEGITISWLLRQELRAQRLLALNGGDLSVWDGGWFSLRITLR